MLISDGLTNAELARRLPADDVDELADGLGAAADGAGELADGTAEAAEGTPALVDGIGEVRDGVGLLKTGGEDTVETYAPNVALLQAANARGAAEALPYGAPEGAIGTAVYSITLAGESGEGGQNLVKALAAIARRRGFERRSDGPRHGKPRAWSSSSSVR